MLGLCCYIKVYFRRFEYIQYKYIKRIIIYCNYLIFSKFTDFIYPILWKAYVIFKNF